MAGFPRVGKNTSCLHVKYQDVKVWYIYKRLCNLQGSDQCRIGFGALHVANTSCSRVWEEINYPNIHGQSILVTVTDVSEM